MTVTSPTLLKNFLGKKTKIENAKTKKKATHGQRRKDNKTPANNRKRSVTGKAKPKLHDSTQCCYCFVTYGATNDAKMNDEWVRCQGCCKWFHESCTEAIGIVEDAEFHCRDCLFCQLNDVRSDLTAAVLTVAYRAISD